MAFITIDGTDIAVDKPITAELMLQMKDNFDYLYGQSGNAVGIPNGAFAIDSDADGLPDSWTISLYANGAASLSTISPIYGNKSLLFVRSSGAGNGGGQAISDYFPVATHSAFWFAFSIKQTSAQPRTKVIIRPYTATLGTLADTTHYDSTANPTVWTEFSYKLSLPTNACYTKVVIQAGCTDKNNAGSIYLANFRMQQQTFLVRQDMLKTSTGSGSLANNSTQLQSLSGGEHGFFPQVRQDEPGGIGYQGRADVFLSNHTASAALGAYIGISNPIDAGTPTISWHQRYVSASGNLLWIFVKRDKDTKRTISTWVSDKHPTYGQPSKIEHPFGSIDLSKEEIICTPINKDAAIDLKSLHSKQNCGADIIRKFFIHDETKEINYPTNAINLGLSDKRDYTRDPDGSPVEVIMEVLTKPEYIKCYPLVKKDE